jgi:hypothetical protein
MNIVDSNFETDDDVDSRFAISFSIQDFLDMPTFCKAFMKSGVLTQQSELWLSWTLFDRVFQSEGFAADKEPKRSTDVIKLRSSRNALLHALQAAFPLRVFLCTEGAILAYADIVLNFSSDDDIPLETSEWFNVTPVESAAQLPLASLKVSVSIESIDDQSKQGLAEPNNEERQLWMAGEDVDSYADEPFEGELETEGTGVKSPLADNNLRHFRLSVAVRSIGALKRSCHAFVRFTYPHLGVKTPVRSQPLWVPANTETELDNASVVYDTVLAPLALRSLADEHPLVVHVSSKAHLGNEDVGYVEVDFSSVFDDAPHSYRCPVTKKTFRTLDDFISHRNAIALLNATGKTTLQCPTHPVEIRALDCYYDLKQRAGGKVVASSDGGRLRVVLVLEDLGVVGYELGVPVRSGYKMQGGGVYEDAAPAPVQQRNYPEGVEIDEAVKSPPPLGEPTIDTSVQKLEGLKIDWENWRRAAEGQWRDELRTKEVALRKALEEENQAALAARADDLRRAHEEAGRLEVRLRSTIDAVEKQKAHLVLKEDQVNMKLAQKSSELQLLERRIREEAKGKVDAETRRCEALERQLESSKESSARMEKRAKDAERDFEAYRQQLRGLPETQLREEVAKLRAQLAETRTEIERERRVSAERELEKEHFRSQMQRLALALKRERERSSAVARQELEQLRLEFLAREER